MTTLPDGAVVLPLRPVEEAFLRTLPGHPQRIVTAVYVLDGSGLRHPDGRLDVDGVRAHLAWWIREDPTGSTRLVRPLLGLAAPAWVSTDDPLDRAISLWPSPVPAEGIDAIAAGLQQVPLDVRVCPIHATVLDCTDGRVGLVIRAHHSWADGVAGSRTLQILTSPEPGPLRRPPEGPPPVGPDGPVRLPLALLRTWWRAQPDAGAALRAWRRRPLSGRVRRVLGRQRWTLLHVATSVGARTRPAEDWAVRRVELPAREVSAAARALGGTTNQLVAAAALRALRAVGASAGPVQRAAVLMADRSSDSTAANRIRVVPIEADTDRDTSDVVRAVRDQLTAPSPTPPTGPVRAHVTTLPGPRGESWFGPSRVEHHAMLPSLGEEEDFGVLAFVRNGTVTVSVATRERDSADAFVAALHTALTAGAPPLGTEVPR